MSLSTQLGKSLPRTRVVVNTLSRSASTSKYDPTKDFPQLEAANIAPYTVLRKDAAYELRQTTAVGTREYSKAYKKYENDPTYNLLKEATGYNSLASKTIIGDPALGEMTHPYFKQYIRDEAGDATMPNRYKGHITYDELQNILQKADHYFFSERPNPVVQLYIPLEDPRISKPESALAKAAALVDRLTSAPSEGLIKDYAQQTMKSDGDLFTFLDKQFENIYQAEAKLVKNNGIPAPVNPDNLHKADADLGTLGQYSLTAQQRRAEFWRKYIDLFNYYDVLHTCNVRCTRSVGRVSQTAALVIIGNCHGIFSYGRGKASNYELAVRRALLRTRRNVLFTPLHENRTAYYRHLGTWKKTSLLLIPHRRGVGMRAGRLTFNLLRSVGYKDATLKMLGCRNMWNLVRAWMECLKIQESYREVAFARGSHYQEIMDPFTKNAPAPSREEVQELENAASVAFHDAIQTVFKNRQLLNIESYSDLKPHFELRDGFEKKWEEHLVKKNVPKEFHIYPAFSEYLDAVGSISNVYKRIKNEQLLERYVVDEFAGYSNHQGYEEFLENEEQYMEEMHDQMNENALYNAKRSVDMYNEYEKPITVTVEAKAYDEQREEDRLYETSIHITPSHDNVSPKDKQTIMKKKVTLMAKNADPAHKFDRISRSEDNDYRPYYNKNISPDVDVLYEKLDDAINAEGGAQEMEINYKLRAAKDNREMLKKLDIDALAESEVEEFSDAASGSGSDTSISESSFDEAIAAVDEASENNNSAEDIFAELKNEVATSKLHPNQVEREGSIDIFNNIRDREFANSMLTSEDVTVLDSYVNKSITDVNVAELAGKPINAKKRLL